MDFSAPALFKDFALDSGAGNEGFADYGIAAGGGEKHFVKNNAFAFFFVEFFYLDFITGRNEVLFAAGFKDCDHGKGFRC